MSAFGEQGLGDEGDNWIVVCSTDVWVKSSPVRLRHQATSKYLSVSGATFGRPIAGQYEITGGFLTTLAVKCIVAIISPTIVY